LVKLSRKATSASSVGFLISRSVRIASTISGLVDYSSDSRRRSYSPIA
jgi:hypothetical protein